MLQRKQTADDSRGAGQSAAVLSFDDRLAHINVSRPLTSVTQGLPSIAALPQAPVGYLAVKRAFDLLNALIQLILFTPLMLIVALAIKLYDRGPVLFQQQRLTKGPHGPVVFNIVKFRTMVVDAENIGSKITGHNDGRITPVGRVLRSLKLDELPQLLNILRGEMSFVGPRPQTLGYVEAFKAHYEAIHARIPAGLTDIASLKYRDEAKILAAAEDPELCYLTQIMPDKIRCHFFYLQHMSLWLDISILWQTVYHVFVLKPLNVLLRRAVDDA